MNARTMGMKPGRRRSPEEIFSINEFFCCPNRNRQTPKVPVRRRVQIPVYNMSAKTDSGSIYIVGLMVCLRVTDYLIRRNLCDRVRVMAALCAAADRARTPRLRAEALA